MSLSPQFLDELKSRVTLSELVGRKVQLTRAGKDLKACCPFHNEKSPSFYVNDFKGFYHCFGCGVHGDAIKFLTETENYSFIEAVKYLADLAGMQLPEMTYVPPEEQDKFKGYYAVMEEAALFFQTQLFDEQAKEAQDYIRARKLKRETLERYQIGFAPADSQGLIRHMQQKGFKAEDLVTLGLAKRSDRDQRLYSFFRHRIMIPVFDQRGRVVAFGGRKLGAEEGPKYINSPETPIFHKGNLFYGIHNAHKAAGRGQVLIVVEGYFDVISLAESGFEGAVAPLGTALTEAQIDLLWKLSGFKQTTPVLAFDGDNAGLRAALRAIDRILPKLSASKSVDFVFMPQGQDPDSYIKNQGAEGFDRLLSQKRSLSAVLFESLVSANPINTPEEKANLKKRLFAKMDEIADPSVRSFYLSDLSAKLRELFSFSKGRFQGKSQAKVHMVQRIQRASPPKTAEITWIRQIILLVTLINHPQLLDHVHHEISSIQMFDEGLEQARQQILLTFDSWSAEDREKGMGELKQQLIPVLEAIHMDQAELDRLYLHAQFASENSMDYHEILNGWLDVFQITFKNRLTQLSQIPKEFANY